jgi:hypothetical protein
MLASVGTPSEPTDPVTSIPPHGWVTLSRLTAEMLVAKYSTAVRQGSIRTSTEDPGASCARDRQSASTSKQVAVPS